MADSNAAANTSLNPAAASFTPSTEPLTNGTTSSAQAPPNQNGQHKEGKAKRPEPVDRSTTAENIAEAGAGVKLTGAQLKKQKAAEKAARRADKVAQKGEAAVVAQQALGGVLQRRPSAAKKEEASGGSHHKRTPSARGLPVRAAPAPPVAEAPTKKKPEVEPKRVPIFSHLYPRTAPPSITTATREIHPSILTLALQISSYTLCGSNARTVGTLLAFKRVISSYTTPPGIALSRHLLTHLNHQIAYLRSARPLCIGQGNAIRWLKGVVSTVDVGASELEAKESIIAAIDAFIRERIVLADEVIAREGATRIDDGDVVLTYGKSSVVEKTLLSAHAAGRDFKVVVLDSRPLFEGRNLARSLLRHGLTVSYGLLSAASDLITREGVTKCLLGASAMLGNGRLQSRAGTATVAMLCKNAERGGRRVPVIVLCETLKFTSKAVLDSIVMNEVGDPDALVERNEPDTLTSIAAPKLEGKGSKGGKGGSAGKKKDEEDDDKDDKGRRGLQGWKEQAGLYLLNLMYDVTPSEFLDLVICELGALPPTAVPVVNGVHGDDQAIA